MRVLFLVAMLCAAGVSVAQWNPNGATTGPIYYTGGNVGIGTTSPNYRLQVISSGALTSSFPVDATIVSSASGTTAAYGGIKMSSDPNSGAAFMGARARDNAGSAGAVLQGDILTGVYGWGHTGSGWGANVAAMRISAAENFTTTAQGTLIDFATTSLGGTARATRMTIDPSGNVGIGLAAPEAKLHVKGVAYFGNENGNSWHRVAIGGSGSSYGSIGYGYKYTTNNNEYIYSVSSYASQLRFDEGGFNFLTAPVGTAAAVVPFTTAMAIKQNGEVQIGASNAITTGYGSRLSFLGASSNGDPLWISRYNTDANVSELRLNIGDDNGEDMFVVGNHHYNGNVWRPHLAVKSNGYVGIGTTNPTQKLEVNGTVYSREVKVDLVAGTGPDYVFEPTYNLPTLAETEAYIKANKHLPEVPSAKEMEANGINLSEMNMLLLKKVEELTLHLVEQNKKIERQQIEIDKLKLLIKE